MTREDIINMARMAGCHDNGEEFRFVEFRFLERLAVLVAKHTLANIDPSSFMSWQEGYEAGRLAEREACAKVCEDMGRGHGSAFAEFDCVAAIRARGNT